MALMRRSKSTASAVRLACIGWAALLAGQQPACGAAGAVSLVPIEAGAFSQQHERSFLVSASSADFGALYRRIHSGRMPPPTAPRVDFAEHVVVIASMGARPTTGYGIGFVGTAQVEEGVATVRVSERAPAAGTVRGAAVTAPYAIATLSRGDYQAVRFVDAAGDVIARIGLAPKPDAAKRVPANRQAGESLSAP